MFKFDILAPKVVTTINAKGDKVGWRQSTSTMSRYVYLHYTNGVSTEKRCYDGLKCLREVTYLHSETKSTVLHINFKGFPTRSVVIENNVYNGKYKEWDDNGNLRLTVNVKGDVLHGILKFYYPNGDVEECVKLFKGKMHGFLKTYHTTGELYKMLEFKKGKAALSSSAYSREGQRILTGHNLTPKETFSLRFIKFWSNGARDYKTFREVMRDGSKLKTSAASTAFTAIYLHKFTIDTGLGEFGWSSAEST